MCLAKKNHEKEKKVARLENNYYICPSNARKACARHKPRHKPRHIMELTLSLYVQDAHGNKVAQIRGKGVTLTCCPPWMGPNRVNLVRNEYRIDGDGFHLNVEMLKDNTKTEQRLQKEAQRALKVARKFCQRLNMADYLINSLKA